MLGDFRDRLREDMSEVEDPRADTLFETTAEVLVGLITAYERGAEEAWRGSRDSRGGKSVASVERSVAIDAPIEKVFGYMDHPPNRVEISPSMAEVKNVRRLPNGGSRSDWVYRIAGVPFEGGVEAVEYAQGRSIVFDLSGGIEGRIRWYFAPEGGGTRCSPTSPNNSCPRSDRR